MHRKGRCLKKSCLIFQTRYGPSIYDPKRISSILFPKLTFHFNSIHIVQSINVDSKNAPKQLHLILIADHPEWKLPERRVAKYLKRLLKSRNDQRHEDIDADLDEASIYSETYSAASNTSGPSWRKEAKSVPDAPSGAVSEPDSKATSSPPNATVTEPSPAPVKEKIIDVASAYEDENKSEKGGKTLCCEGCIISQKHMSECIGKQELHALLLETERENVQVRIFRDKLASVKDETTTITHLVSFKKRDLIYFNKTIVTK